MLALTEQAQEVIRGFLEDSDFGTDGGLRITGSGSNGDTALDFGLAAGPIDGDAVVSQGGARVFLDEIAAAVLEGKTLDVAAHGDHFHFEILEEEAV